MGISDQHHEQSDLEDEKVLNEKWLKSVTALNVAKLELTQLKKKNLELEIKKLEQDTADRSNCQRAYICSSSFLCLCFTLIKF